MAISIAPINPTRIPGALASAPRFHLGPSGVAPSPMLALHPDSLAAFARTWRDLLAEVERAHPNAKRWHVIAAVPVSIAVEIGRAFMRDAHPPVSVYQLDGDIYFEALKVNE